ncbi:hypothetical protein SAMD00019534_063310 [Acytostelium subglobosum LB1]|uniref:hypothetical protein n=1 Tax=Acytostelium subglobosum LB1 TaxID=1410327 RepID=UPI0006449679|nr:hypothetical protein SAMD00019534_063310 [Acytostelium subglobosum LB1]GAM23156.1 hypothetical protein SAMD00019534_063310 [Acytostelium subglobosum LB1]|eukprot:XP_012753605.1 hypothetical protein SAMD00019534_063310 [Acytostelium subglobosum LB1]
MFKKVSYVLLYLPPYLMEPKYKGVALDFESETKHVMAYTSRKTFVHWYRHPKSGLCPLEFILDKEVNEKVTDEPMEVDLLIRFNIYHESTCRRDELPPPIRLKVMLYFTCRTDLLQNAIVRSSSPFVNNVPLDTIVSGAIELTYVFPCQLYFKECIIVTDKTDNNIVYVHTQVVKKEQDEEVKVKAKADNNKRKKSPTNSKTNTITNSNINTNPGWTYYHLDLWNHWWICMLVSNETKLEINKPFSDYFCQPPSEESEHESQERSSGKRSKTSFSQDKSTTSRAPRGKTSPRAEKRGKKKKSDPVAPSDINNPNLFPSNGFPKTGEQISPTPSLGMPLFDPNFNYSPSPLKQSAPQPQQHPEPQSEPEPEPQTLPKTKSQQPPDSHQRPLDQPMTLPEPHQQAQPQIFSSESPHLLPEQ